MFEGAESFTSDLSKWQTGNVTGMSQMFEGATALRELPPWYTSE
jgi:surface protein